MPHKNPRLSIVVSPEFDAAISDLAQLTGQSKSATVWDVLEPATGFFREIADHIRSQKQLKAEPALQLQSNLDAIMTRMLSGPGLSEKATGLLLELVKEIEAADDAKAPAPRPVTRGAKSLPNPSPSSSPSLSSPLKSTSRH